MPLCSTSDCADGNNVCLGTFGVMITTTLNTSALWSSRIVDPGAAAVVMGRRGWAVLLLHSRFHPVLLWPVLGRPVVIASSAPYAIRTPTHGPVRAVNGIDVIKFAVWERDRKIVTFCQSNLKKY